jgi:hypothetical protein
MGALKDDYEGVYGCPPRFEENHHHPHGDHRYSPTTTTYWVFRFLNGFSIKVQRFLIEISPIVLIVHYSCFTRT